MEMTNEELQKLLTSFEQEVGHIKEWQIDRSEQIKSVNKNGGKASLGSGKYKHIQSMGGKVAGRKSVESGHLKSICSDGGKAGAKSQMEKKIGIHTDDVELRRQWAILGGKKSAAALNQTRICPHCGKTSAGGGYYRWHGDKCKSKNII